MERERDDVHRLLLGRTLLDRDGREAGTVRDAYLDDATGEPVWLEVRTGRLRHHEVLVPAGELQPAGEAVQVPYDADRVHDAPRAGDGDHLSAEVEAALAAYWGVRGGPAAGAPAAGVGAPVTGGEPVEPETPARPLAPGEVVLRQADPVLSTERRPQRSVRLGTRQVTEYVTKVVPVVREEPVVEEVPAGTPGSMVLTGDEVIVGHEVRPVERASLGVDDVAGAQEIVAPLRREEVEVEVDGESVDAPIPLGRNSRGARAE